MDDMVKALLIERAGYERRGLDERAAAVDEQLAARGYAQPPAAATAPPARTTARRATRKA